MLHMTEIFKYLAKILNSAEVLAETDVYIGKNLQYETPSSPNPKLFECQHNTTSGKLCTWPHMTGFSQHKRGTNNIEQKYFWNGNKAFVNEEGKR